MNTGREIKLKPYKEYLFVSKSTGMLTVCVVRLARHNRFAVFIQTKKSFWIRVSVNQFNKRNLIFVGEI